MGLDVGVVSIRYLDRPPEPAYGFLWEVAASAGWDDGWGGGFDGNAFVEYERAELLRKAREYATEKALMLSERRSMYGWIRRLPGDGSTVMLHLNW